MNKVIPKRRTQTERREFAESRLLSAAIELLTERGYDGFTLADVGEAAGFSRGLPAHYFGRKEVLLAKAVRAAVDQYVQSLLHDITTPPGMQRIAEVIRHHARIGPTKGSRALNILLSEASFRPALHTTISDLTEQGMIRLRTELQRGIAAGSIRADIDVERSARMIFAFLRGQMSFFIMDEQFDPLGVSETFIAMLEMSLSPQT